MAKKDWSVTALFRTLGPGLVTGAADDDPSGIATYSQGGAQFGFGMCWTMFLTAPFMIAIQLVSARIGAVTGRGLAANLMKAMPAVLLYVLVGLLLIANTLNLAADIAAMGEALRLVVGGPVLVYVAAIWNLLSRRGNPDSVSPLCPISEGADARAVRLCRRCIQHPDSLGRSARCDLRAAAVVD